METNKWGAVMVAALDVMDENKKKTVLQIMEMGKNLFSQMDSHQKVQKLHFSCLWC